MFRKAVDFNISYQKSKETLQQVQQNVNVYYPNIPESKPEAPVITARGIEQNEEEFYKFFSEMLLTLLTESDLQLTLNLLDTTGTLLLKPMQLVELIGKYLTFKGMPTQLHDIVISYDADEPGCLSKVKPIKRIQKIYVNHKDFEITYNELYLEFMRITKISLKALVI